jgi:hypothetical protein
MFLWQRGPGWPDGTPFQPTLSNYRILTVVFTWRSANRRLISARGANSYEKRLYETEIRAQGSATSDRLGAG